MDSICLIYAYTCVIYTEITVCVCYFLKKLLCESVEGIKMQYVKLFILRWNILTFLSPF